ncbi:MAG: DNA mismatch repair protein MutS [Chitinophagaceae bacterium]|jgi:DNA mismatch repair ATPase MutS|nr:DNA mismatch repair protein MutS [Chitinophagaceae bacterium]
MQIDKTSYYDLAIFQQEEEFSVFHKLDFTRTAAGKDWLMKYFREPFSTLPEIEDTQQILRRILPHVDSWPQAISNGTLLVMEKFLDYNLDPLPESADNMNSYLYRLLHSPDFSLARYSLNHFAEFVKGMQSLVKLLDDPQAPARLQTLLSQARMLLQHRQLDELGTRPEKKSFSVRETVYYGRFFHDHFRHHALTLIQIFSQLDAWYAMAKAMQVYGLSFPKMTEQEDPYIEATGLYHLLLDKPVAYDLSMNPKSNFIFLTGANMAGKSTFIKSVGLAVFLAHLGMGVPAKEARMTLFDGILSNINVVDNIAKGESYFFNEVQRIKHTVQKINDNRRWLVLIDELFKGTNIQDAMKCSTTVIKGLIKINRALFILSTHLYEIGDELRDYPNISFKYFETNIHDDQLSFSYQLKEGISNDRLGYLILKREKVVELLDQLPSK